jgi:hypothetical protein
MKKKQITLKQFEKMCVEACNRENKDDHLNDKERRRIVNLAKKLTGFVPTGDLDSDFCYVIFSHLMLA